MAKISHKQKNERAGRHGEHFALHAIWNLQSRFTCGQLEGRETWPEKLFSDSRFSFRMCHDTSKKDTPTKKILWTESGHTMKSRAWLAAIVLLTGLSTGQQSNGQQTENKPEPAPNERAAEKYFTDTVLVDQDGKEQRFYTDLIKDKVVIINAMFATCKDSCPTMEANFARIQKWLGPKLGTDVRLISISVDPETDTPPVLKQYGGRFDARPGWYFLTGKKQNVDLILHKLGLYVENKQDHLNLFLIGNDHTGLWKKALGVSDSEKLIGIVQSVLDDSR
jgi:protein SCO1/2